MKRLLTLNEFIKENDLVGSDVWILTKFQKYIEEQRFKLPRDDVSTSYYLYGVEANHFKYLVSSQETFISVRVAYLNAIIKMIQKVSLELRDDERLSACIDAHKWCMKMNKEILE